jgi:ribonuclease I
MGQQLDYFEKCIKILKELKKDYPDVEISKHYSLATDCGDFLSDKELFHALQKHKGELEINTLSIDDAEKVIAETEELFKEGEPEDENWEEELEDIE